jgi:effector-binding domain-containing protein
MSSDPQFTQREPQPYAAIRLDVAQDEIGRLAPPLIGDVIGWVERHGKQVGPVFFNYLRMHDGRVEMEVGAPTDTFLDAGARFTTGMLPGGRYAEVTYRGHYDGLRDAHMALHDWLGRQGMRPADGPSGEAHTLLEIYVTDPDEVPDPADWITQLAFKIPD